jgi:ribosomal protein L11 methyltransferase
MSEAPWIRLAVTPSVSEFAESVMVALFQAGAQGVHEDGRTLVTHLEPGTDVEPLVAAVHALDDAASIEVSDFVPTDWSLTYRDHIGAHTLGALTIAPPWLADQYDAATTIVVDPAMAFGTGEHPTTRGVVRLMQRVVRPGDFVADLGAGSAVLSIAAVKLGAARVAAIELEHDAIGNANENVERNGVADRVTVIEGDAKLLLPLVAPVRVVFANIISSVLVELLGPIREALTADGAAILSGLLVDERPSLLKVIAMEGFEVVEEDAEGDWWSVSVRVRR